jgi:methyl-accepting chemotaxis protein
MTWFKNRRMAMKLALAFGACVLLTVAVGMLALWGMSDMDGASTRLATHASGRNAIKEANLGVLRASRAVRNALLDENAADVKGRIADIQTYRDDYVHALAEFEKTIETDEAKEALVELRRLDTRLRPAQDELTQLALEGKVDEAKAKLKAARAVADAVDQQIERIEKTKEQVMAAAVADNAAAYATTTRSMVMTIAVAALIGFVVAVFLTRLITQPLGESVRVLKAVAQADFTQSLTLDTKDELGDMARALNEASSQMRTAVSDVRSVATAMAAGDLTVQVRTDLPGMLGEMASALADAMVKVRTALDEVRAASDTVASAAQQLASASEEISSGAQEQASSLEETAASLEEITATIKQNADNAQQASQLAGGARATAENGGQVVNDAVSAMDAINESSSRIADIITTIDEIAFQTNLLALNAAVEAARAGEQGRGFAVVAAEVRNLAQRSASAAKEIKALIQDSVKKVGAGSELVSASGRTLNEIVTSVKRVTDIVAEIAAASREQSGGIEQVNKAVTQMDQVTQANASQTEEMSGTAESLAGEAGKLQALIAQFKLGEGRTQGTSRTAAAAAPRNVVLPRGGRSMASRGNGNGANGVPKPAVAAAVASHGNGAHALDAEFQEY